MSAPTKPSEQPEWATSGEIIEPSGPKKLLGWIVEKVPFQFLNWWMNLVFQWTSYAEDMTDYLADQDDTIFSRISAEFDAIVGAAAFCTDDNIGDAIARVSAGARILVIDSFALASTVTVNKAGIEIVLKGNVIISPDGATKAFSVSAAGCIIRGGQISGFSANGIEVLAGGNRFAARDIYFDSNGSGPDDDILDTLLLSTAIGCVN